MANAVTIVTPHTRFAVAPTPWRVALPPFYPTKPSRPGRLGDTLGVEVITSGRRPNGKTVRHRAFHFLRNSVLRNSKDYKRKHKISFLFSCITSYIQSKCLTFSFCSLPNYLLLFICFNILFLLLFVLLSYFLI